MISFIKFIISPIILGFLGYEVFNWLNSGGFKNPNDSIEIINLLIFIGVGLGTAFVARIPGNNKDITADRETGTVKWFNTKKGFGFILCDQGDEVFVHYRGIIKHQDKQTIEQGQRVSFVIVSNDKGLQAEQVQVI